MSLQKAATEVRENAYAPYSGFQVGAAVRGASGTIYAGCNVENVAYPEGTCAEAGAIAAMVAAGETGAGTAIGGSGGSGLPAAADGGAGDAFAGLSLAERAKPNSPPANITGPAKERWV